VVRPVKAPLLVRLLPTAETVRPQEPELPPGRELLRPREQVLEPQAQLPREGERLQLLAALLVRVL
jgi:hypothetical protein